MELKKKKLLEALMETSFVFPQDIPNIELYMDQVTTFMDTHLAKSKRYADDKIMTKTMINNYTKNQLLPPSNKKKYSKNHIFLIIMIYYLKSILSISDIKNLLQPLGSEFFPVDEKSGLSVEEIFARITENVHATEEETKKDILRGLEESQGLFQDFDLEDEQLEYLDDTTYILRLSYDIFMRKRMIEKLLDHRQSKLASHKKDEKKKHKK